MRTIGVRGNMRGVDHTRRPERQLRIVSLVAQGRSDCAALGLAKLVPEGVDAAILQSFIYGVCLGDVADYGTKGEGSKTLGTLQWEIVQRLARRARNWKRMASCSMRLRTTATAKFVSLFSNSGRA